MLRRELQELEGVRFEAGKSSESFGQRNWLASQAQFPYLVFLDGISARPMRGTWNATSNCCPLIRSGWVEPPTARKHQRKADGCAGSMARPARNDLPWPFLCEGNTVFLLSIFDPCLHLSIRFRESIMHYGHEDTLFGVELSAHGIVLSHCDNPCFTKGLDEDPVFLKRPEQAFERFFSTHRGRKAQKGNTPL